MEAEASSFETSEMLATFLASTPLLSESWKLCSHANAAAPHGFVVNRIGGVAYVAFSGVQSVAGLDSDPGCRNLVALDSAATDGLFSELHRRGEGEEPVMVHAGMLHLFLSMFEYTNFQIQGVWVRHSGYAVFEQHCTPFVSPTTPAMRCEWSSRVP